MENFINICLIINYLYFRILFIFSRKKLIMYHIDQKSFISEVTKRYMYDKEENLIENTETVFNPHFIMPYFLEEKNFEKANRMSDINVR